MAAQVARTEEEESNFKRKLARGQWRVGRNRVSVALSQEKVESYEEAFKQIQEATGISDIDEQVGAVACSAYAHARVTRVLQHCCRVRGLVVLAWAWLPRRCRVGVGEPPGPSSSTSQRDGPAAV